MRRADLELDRSRMSAREAVETALVRGAVVAAVFDFEPLTCPACGAWDVLGLYRRPDGSQRCGDCRHAEGVSARFWRAFFALEPHRCR